MTTRAQESIEKHIRGFIKNPNFVLTDENYEDFLKWMKSFHPELRNIEMALAFLTIQTMSRDKFIVERGNVEEDVRLLIKVIIDMYKHVFDNKSTLLLLTEALDIESGINDLEFRSVILKGETDFESIIALIRKPVTPQPVFVQ